MEKKFSDYFINKALNHLISNELFGEVSNEQVQFITKELKKYSKKVTYDQIANSVNLERLILSDIVLECNKATVSNLIDRASVTEHFNITELGNIHQFVQNGVVNFLLQNSLDGDRLYLLTTPAALSMAAGTIPTFSYTTQQGFTSFSGDDYQGLVNFTPTKTMKMYTSRFYDDTKVLVFCGSRLDNCIVKKITLNIDIK